MAVWILGILIISSVYATAQSPALHVGLVVEARDEFGKTLKGTAPGASRFGITPVEGDLVQILGATAGIHPPHSNGQPHFFNPIIASARIGDGVAVTDPLSGKFGISLPHRPSSPIFLRVFNAATAEAASFYADSEVLAVSSIPRWVVDIGATDRPLDPNDNDGDGLNNSWEESYGSDPHTEDSDQDGSTDLEEHLAGTDLGDASSQLSICDMDTSPDGLRMTWCTVPSKTYQIEHADCPTTGHAFSPVGSAISATSTTTSITLPVGAGVGCYRVTLVQP